MLHSTHKNCSSRHKAYTKWFRTTEDTAEEKKRQIENEIVSTIFGPLDFLTANDSYRLMKSIVGNGAPELVPIDVVLRFWEPRKKYGKGKGIEPDAFFSYTFQNGEKHHFLIEFKWDSELGDCQLKKQWEEYLNPDERKCCTHLFIGKTTTTARQAIKDGKTGGAKNNLVIMEWSQIKNILSGIKDNKTPLGKLANLAEDFLGKVGVDGFTGFSEIKSPIATPPGTDLFSSSRLYLST